MLIIFNYKLFWYCICKDGIRITPFPSFFQLDPSVMLISDGRLELWTCCPRNGNR